MTSMKSTTTQDIREAAKEDLLEMQSTGSSKRQKSNPRLLKPLSVHETLTANKSILNRKKEEKNQQKNRMNELSKEFDKDKVGVTAESLINELSDAFGGGQKTQAEKNLKQKGSKQGSALFKAAEDTASVTSQPEGEMDEKALRRQKLKERAYQMSQKSKGGVSDTTSQMSDMSY